MAFSARKRDLTNATYLDRLGTSSAAQYAPIVLQQAPSLGASLPLDAANADQLLRNTIAGLEKAGHLPKWDAIPFIRQEVFMNAWYTEMAKHGIL
jgi:hypothetical protein